jgi:hypothetical protein
MIWQNQIFLGLPIGSLVNFAFMQLLSPIIQYTSRKREIGNSREIIEVLENLIAKLVI